MRGFVERFRSHMADSEPQLTDDERELKDGLDSIRQTLDDKHWLALVPGKIEDYDLGNIDRHLRTSTREARFTNALWVLTYLGSTAHTLIFFKDDNDLTNKIIYQSSEFDTPSSEKKDASGYREDIIDIEVLRQIKVEAENEFRRGFPGKIITPKLKDTEQQE